jgi:hypothetical protein
MRPTGPQIGVPNALRFAWYHGGIFTDIYRHLPQKMAQFCSYSCYSFTSGEHLGWLSPTCPGLLNLRTMWGGDDFKGNT